MNDTTVRLLNGAHAPPFHYRIINILKSSVTTQNYYQMRITRKMKKLVLPMGIVLISLLFVSTSHAQNYWRGGTPGKETDWNTAKNWSQNRVPDWSQDVIIPDVSTQSGYYPMIDKVVDMIPHLEIHSNATLTIQTHGKIVIDGQTTFNSGIFLSGELIAKGDLLIVHTALQKIDLQGGEFIAGQQNFAFNELSNH